MPVCFHPLDAHQLRRELRLGECGLRENPLVCHVVDREYRPRVFVERVAFVDRLEIRGDKTRGPVIAMDDVRLPAQFLQDLEHTPAEENEPFVIVRVVLLRVGVHIETRASEQVGVVNEVDLDFDRVVCDEGRLDARGARPGPHRDLDLLQADHVVELRFPLVDAAVFRHDHADLVLAPLDALREGV